MGAQNGGIDPQMLQQVAADVAAARALGKSLAIVVGGGNIFRGMAGAAKGLERGRADYMGMLATVMNALALHSAIDAAGVPASVMSAIPMPTICESFNAEAARSHLDAGRVVVFAAGTGNPYFTTDTAAALRAAEMHCDAIAKATKVDGVYSADPERDPNAIRYDEISHDDVLAKHLKVMDAAAIALAREARIPIIVFSIREEGNFVKVLQGQARSTLVRNKT